MALKILLINEYVPKLKQVSEKYGLPWFPLWAGIIRNLTPKEHSIDFIDCSHENLKLNEVKNYDLVCLSVLTPNANVSYKIAEVCRKNNIPCVLGGQHVSALPSEAAQHCDAVVIGECEGIWCNLIEDLLKDKLKKVYNGYEKKLKYIPYLDRTIYRKYNYAFDNIEVMRGCPYKCEFCTISYSYNGQCKYKTVSVFTREINEITKKNVILIGPNIAVKKRQAKEYFDIVGQYNLRWGVYASANLLIDHLDLLDSLHRSNCLIIEIGFEDKSQTKLKSMNKYHNQKVEYKRLICQLHDRGILVNGSFIVGWDTDDKSVFTKVLNLIQDLEIDVPYIFVPTPFPNTALFNRLIQEGRILTTDWSRYSGADIVFKPKNMTREELLVGYIECMEELHSMKKEVTRFLSRWRGLRRLPIFSIISHYHSIAGKAYIKLLTESLECN